MTQSTHMTIPDSNSMKIVLLNSEIFQAFFQNLATKNFKGLTQTSTTKLKVEIQFYIDSENFMKKYQNSIEFYYFERNQLFVYLYTCIAN